MGLDLPDLDDRQYDDLLEAAKKLVPVYSEEWTNYNPHDPGIAILEVLAWLTETYTYQLDRITDEHREKYLKLLGEKTRPPSVASVRLILTPPEGASGAQIPAGEKLEVVDGSGFEKTFETDHDIVLTHASVRTILSERGPAGSDERTVIDTDARFYRPFGDEAVEGSAMYIGFDGDPFRNAETLWMTVDYHDDDLPSPASHGTEDPTFEPTVAVAWEYCTDYRNWTSNDSWTPIEVLRDDSKQLYRGGVVTLGRPDDWSPPEEGVDDVGIRESHSELVWIRCRLERAGYEIPPRVNGVHVNVVEASHRSTHRDERLVAHQSRGPSPGRAERTYRFEHSPVLEAAITVDGESWTEVDDFEASAPTDTHYVLDRADGAVRFGDNVRGATPRPDQRVVAEQYVHGGGDDGNVPESSVWRFANEGKTVGTDGTLGDTSAAPRGPATGGSDAESLDEAFRRVRRDLRTPYRCVTTEDFEYVATHTPGLRIGRATAYVEPLSADDGTERPPAVTVVVVPYAPSDSPNPAPSEGVLAAVHRHLDRHRLLTDGVTVVAPTYVGIDLTVAVRSTTPHPRPRENTSIESVLEAYFDPNHGYDGDGWPIGRSLDTEELFDVIAAIDWVAEIDDLSVEPRAPATVDAHGTLDGGETALFTVEDLSVDVRTENRGGNRDRR